MRIAGRIGTVGAAHTDAVTKELDYSVVLAYLERVCLVNMVFDHQKHPADTPSARANPWGGARRYHGALELGTPRYIGVSLGLTIMLHGATPTAKKSRNLNP